MTLPIDEIVALVRERRAAVITAPPGSGKTTQVPPALSADGPVLLLQPRRVAARAIARYIAQQQGWTLGREVGWQVRFERRFSADTRLLVATEGILTARLQDDPLLTAFHTVVIDEFHERSIHADLGLALAREAWRARGDLRLVVMSATIDARRVADYLDGAPVIDVPGRMFPIEITYRPGMAVEDAVAERVTCSTAGLKTGGSTSRTGGSTSRTGGSSTGGAVLCFLPGASEIRRAAERLATTLPRTIPVLPLHGGLDADEQDAALAPTGAPRVILATNLAETTLTIPDVTCVVDAGTHKVARYDADRGIDSLVLERITQDSADQRAGRAGRVAPGLAIRLWDARDRLRPHREPEIARVDLASAVLDVIGWGGDPETVAWFEPPPGAALTAAFALLQALGALDAARRLTPRGRAVQRLPLHPRLATLLIAAGGAPEAARACALLSERRFVPPRTAATTCDLLSAVEREHLLPPNVARAARDIRSAARAAVEGPLADRIDDADFRRAILAAYPDRVARRRPSRTGATPGQTSAGSDRFVLASGAGARLSRDSGVHEAEFVVAVDITRDLARRSEDRRLHSAADEALIRMATRVEREWLEPTSSETRHEVGDDGRVRAWRVERYHQLTMSEHPVPPDPDHAAALLAEAYLSRPLPDRDRQLQRRIAFAGLAVDLAQIVGAAARTAQQLSDISLEDALPLQQRAALQRHAPLTLALPGGSRARLDYREDGRVIASVKLQHLFGVQETPLLGPRRTPVTFELLAPNGRPVQVTQDLRSFWQRGYPEIRKQLRGRYPKHAWPEDPSSPRV
jgi:ATP-dependent helicase HrpB